MIEHFTHFHEISLTFNVNESNSSMAQAPVSTEAHRKQAMTIQAYETRQTRMRKKIRMQLHLKYHNKVKSTWKETGTKQNHYGRNQTKRIKVSYQPEWVTSGQFSKLKIAQTKQNVASSTSC